MAFRNLLYKEIRSIFPLFAVFTALVIISHLFILYKRASLGNEVFFVLSLVMPFLFVSAIAIGAGYYQLHVEWKTNSIYLLLSLPVRGWKVISAKLAAVLSLLIASIMCIGISFVVILLRGQLVEMYTQKDWPIMLPTLLNVAVNTSWMYCLAVLFMLSVVQFAFLCGQLVAKFKWLVVFCAFFAAMWLVFRLSPLLSALLLWTPELFYGGTDLDVEILQSGPFIVLLLLSIGFIWLNGYIFEREVEV